MRVFCSQCGTPNEGKPGTKVMCSNCTAVFDVPGVDPGLANTVMSGAQPSTAPQPPLPPAPPIAVAPPQGWTPPQPSSAPPQPGTLAPSQPTPSWGAPAVNPGQPGPLYPAPAASSGPQTETLAIVSLVLGILCCIPFGSIAAIITGALAIQKINANPSLGGKGLAIAGISLGGVAVAMSVLWFIIALATNH